VSKLTTELCQVRAEVRDLQMKCSGAWSVEPRSAQCDDQWPPLVSGSEASAMPLPPFSSDRTTKMSFATHVQAITTELNAFKNKPVRKPVIGTS